MKDKIFISHSSKDIKIIKSFVEKILRLGLDIPAERIFCTSMEGQGVKSGQYIPERLKVEIHSASLVLLFISQNYKNSEVCLNEVGAAWATLDNERIIPVLLPDVDFNEIGFLNIGRLGIKLYEENSLLQLINDTRSFLQIELQLPRLNKLLKEFLSNFPHVSVKAVPESIKETNQEADEWTNCFKKNLYVFNEVIRKSIPTYEDGIHEISDPKIRKNLLQNLSQTSFLETLWYRFSGGDSYVQSMKCLPSGNWLISVFGLELNVSSLWVNMSSSIQDEFILLRTEPLPPYKISSDVGGESFLAGELSDGTTVSPNELQNGYAIIGGDTVSLRELKVIQKERWNVGHWIFLVTGYNKVGYSHQQAIKFCKTLDAGQVEVNKKNLRDFLDTLKNHPTVIKYH